MDKAFQVKVNATTHNRMKVLAAKLDIGMSTLIRKAVDEILERHQAEADKREAAKA